MKHKQNDWAHPLDSHNMPICISRCGKHGDQAAMRAEPFHQQWFVLITHEKHKALKMFRSNIIICVSLLETATEN